MTFRFIALSLLSCGLSACLQAENSNSQDSYLNEGDTIVGLFSQNCASCHAYHTRSEEEFIRLELVIPEDPENSELYYRLNGSLGAKGPKDMPVGGSLSPSELEMLRLWIENLN